MRTRLMLAVCSGIICVAGPCPGLMISSSSLDNLAARATDIVVAELTPIPGEQCGMWCGDNAELEIIRSYKGVLREGTSISANTFFSPLATLSDRLSTPSVLLKTENERIIRLLVLRGGAKGRCVAILTTETQLKVGTSAADMHPLNHNAWSGFRDIHSIIPISKDILLEFDPATSGSAARVLFDREWQRQSKLGQLDCNLDSQQTDRGSR